jgi:hypothetical protein
MKQRPYMDYRGKNAHGDAMTHISMLERPEPLISLA